MDIQEIMSGIGSSQALQDAAGKAGVDPAQAQSMLQGVLEHVSSGSPLEGMAEGVAGKVGVDPSLVQQFLPSILGLLQNHSANASEGVQGVLGGIIGSLQGSAAGAAPGGASLADEAMGLAKGLFGNKGT